MSAASRLAEPHASEPGNAPPRPKVMRRPLQFSQPQPQLPQHTTAPAQNPTASKPPAPEEKLLLPTARVPTASAPIYAAWQDDARFGILMVLAVLAFNALLIVALPHLRPATVSLSSVQPEPAAQTPSSDVTLYTKPIPFDETKRPFAEPDDHPVHILGAPQDDMSQ